LVEVELADGHRLAVVDDDPSVREALQALLRSAGFAVESFASAEDFLRLAERSDFDCLLLDVRMPGMSGLELQEHLASSGSRIPVLFMSAHADASLRTRAGGGAVRLLQKPFSEDALLEAIEASLRRGPV
jgi:two-component system, LuxR family, response regulator FixJ